MSATLRLVEYDEAIRANHIPIPESRADARQRDLRRNIPMPWSTLPRTGSGRTRSTSGPRVQMDNLIRLTGRNEEGLLADRIQLSGMSDFALDHLTVLEGDPNKLYIGGRRAVCGRRVQR